MNYTVFYSWQSDLDNKYHRSFIHDALEKAVKSISKNKEFSLDAVVDRDTYGIPGSPSIVESITGKIARSDVFVCDISIINATSEKRATPNPNVLYELGYASAILGWDRIIMIQNTVSGGPDKLPFDLRGRRILPYYLDVTVENKANEKQKLKEKLIDTFAEALQYYSTNYTFTQKEKVIWWGKWQMDSKIYVRGGQLHISRVSSDAFFFDLTIFDGARSGEIKSKAQILTPHSAYAKIACQDKNCEIIFRRRLEGNTWYIEIEEGPNCSAFHGLGATFSGTFKHTNELIINKGYLDEIDMNEIERITGKYLSVFLNNFQQFGVSYEYDSTVISTGVKGMYNIMEAITVLDKTGAIWCACLDSEADVDVVRYFTNVTGDTKSKTKALEEWLSKFSNRPIIINNVVPEQLSKPLQNIQDENSENLRDKSVLPRRILGKERKRN